MKFLIKKFKNFYAFLGAYKDEASRMFDEDHIVKLEKITNVLSKTYRSPKTLFCLY